MDGSLIALVGLVLVLLILDLAALGFGCNSRDGEREMPGVGDLPPLRRPAPKVPKAGRAVVAAAAESRTPNQPKP